jgi:hypothetical protein
MNLRTRRIGGEWELLAALAAANAAALAATRVEDEFHVFMRQSPAWVKSSSEPRIATEHDLRFVYPRFYPVLPLEAYFVCPILHVNVDPVTGFVCLWREYQPSQTIVDAVLITRAIMACETANWDPVHCMQPDAVAFRSKSHALPMPALTLPESCRLPLLHRRPGRQRLWSELPAVQTRE